MTGFSLRFRAPRVSFGALLFVIVILVTAIGIVAVASGRQLLPQVGNAAQFANKADRTYVQKLLS